LPLRGRQSQAGKKGGSYKQIQSSQQQQQLSTRLQAIASQLSTADVEFVGAAFTCIGTQGGDVVKHLMGELAAANTRADKAEAEAVDFQLRSASSKPRNGITGNAGVFIHFALGGAKNAGSAVRLGPQVVGLARLAPWRGRWNAR
jgi:hypothetical protein